MRPIALEEASEVSLVWCSGAVLVLWSLLFVFHIITSRSALGVKELTVQFHRLLIVPLPVSEEKNDLQFPENLTVPFPFSVQKIKLPGSH